MLFIKVEKEESESRISTPQKKNGKGKKIKMEVYKVDIKGRLRILKNYKKL